MNWWLLLTFFIIFIIIFMLVTKIHVTIIFFNENQNDHLQVGMKAWYGLISYTYRVPVIKGNDESFGVTMKEETGLENKKKDERKKEVTPSTVMERIRTFQTIIHHVTDFYPIVKRFLSHIHVKKFEWKSEVGTGDAAVTGMLAGMVWTIKGCAIAIMSQYIKLKEKPIINVKPSFQKTVSATRLECIFSIRVGYAIGAGFKLVKQWYSRKRSPVLPFTVKQQL